MLNHLLKTMLVLILFLSSYSKISAAEDEIDEDSLPRIQIPLNGDGNDLWEDDTNDNNVTSPMQYAAKVVEGLDCKDKNCELAIIKYLDYKTESDELTNYYQMHLLYSLYTENGQNSEQVELLKKKLVFKLNGFRTLEKMIQNAGYPKAAKYLNTLLGKNSRKQCLNYGIKVGKLYYCSPQNNLDCQTKCYEGSLNELIDSTEDADFREILVGAISETNKDVISAVENTCRVDLGGPPPITGKLPMTNALDALNALLPKGKGDRLCGILSSKSVLAALSGAGTSFAGGESLSVRDFACKKVRIAIEKGGKIFTPDPILFMNNFVILPDNQIHRFDEADYLAITKAVKAYQQSNR